MYHFYIILGPKDDTSRKPGGAIVSNLATQSTGNLEYDNQKWSHDKCYSKS